MSSLPSWSVLIYLLSQLFQLPLCFLSLFFASSASRDLLRAGYQWFGLVSSAHVVYLRLRFVLAIKICYDSSVLDICYSECWFLSLCAIH